MYGKNEFMILDVENRRSIEIERKSTGVNDDLDRIGTIKIFLREFPAQTRIIMSYQKIRTGSVQLDIAEFIVSTDSYEV